MHKKIIFIILLASLLVALFPFSAFALPAPSYEILYNADWPTNAYSDTISDYSFGVYDYTGNPSISNRFLNIYKQNESDFYYFLVYTYTVINGVNKYYYSPTIVCDGPKADTPTGWVRVGNGGGTTSVNVHSNGTYNADYDLTFTASASISENWDNNHFVPANVPIFPTLEDGLHALRNAIDNGTTGGGSALEPKFLSIDIQPGTCAFVSVTGGQFTLKATFDNKFSSGLLSSARYFYRASLPTGNFSIGNGSDVNMVVWTATEPFDILRRTYNGIMNVDDLPSGYVAIYNPINGINGFNGDNPVIHATFSHAVSVVQYPLDNTLDGGVAVGVGSSDNAYVADNSMIDDFGNANYVHYDLDANGNVVTSSAVSLPVGGNNIIDTSDNSLTGLVDRILYLLSAPIRHIQQLFNSGQQFMSMLGSLWAWLPEPVYVILTSALVVLVVIGVIKFLWK